MRRTTKTGRYAKIAASAVVVLLFGLVTSTALADDSPFSALPGDNPFSALGGDNGFSALDALTGSTSTSTITTPTVSSDKGDYAPGELVTLRGTNWHPGEAVHIHVNDDLGATWERDSDVVADEDGVIVDSFNLPNWFVATYAVIATGATSGTATAAFTDANPQSVQIAPGSLTVAPGSSAVYSVSVPIAGNDGLCTLDLSASGLPAGATATFGNTSLTGTKGDSPSTSLTVVTTGVTPPGTATFTVTAARQSNCQGNGNLTGTANLVVAKSVGAVAVGAQTGTLTAGTAGTSTYSVTVSRNGATGTAFTANLSATGLPAGATASFNPNTVSFASGDASKTSTMTITTTSAAAAASTPFTVRATNPNATGDFSEGDGNLLVGAACTAASVTTHPSNQSITYGANATFTAAGAGNPAPSVQWQVSTNGGSSWTNLSGATATSLTITKPGASQSGNQYRAVFTNTCGGTKTATSNAATLNVAAKAITITPDGGQSKVYGASEPTLTYTANPALETGDSFTGAPGRAADENVGSYAITLGNLSAGPNYAISLSTPPVTFAITKKAITVAADDKTKVYGSDDPALTVTVPAGALETGDSLSGNLERENGKDVGSYQITKGSLTAGDNYDLTVTRGTLTITKKAATLTAVDTSKVYGSADPELTTTYSDFLATDFGAGKITFSATRAAGESVGAYAITPAASDAATSLLGNYDVTYKTGQLTITTKAATLTAVDTSKVYGSADPELTTTYSDFLAADLGAGKITFSATRAAGESVGAYAITPAASDATTSLLGNYQVTINTGQLTITKKAITGSFKAADKVYDSNTDAVVTSRDLAGVVGDDAVSLVGGSAVFDTKNAGTAKTVTLTGATLSGADTGNYSLESVATAKADITPKPITVSADDQTKVYGSADPALTVTVPTGALESGDSLSGELVRAAGKDVGGYAITKGSLTASGNYDLTVTPGTLTITKKAITVTADDKTKVYGSADPALTVTVPTGALESGDSLSGELVRAAGKDVGGYAITKGSLTAGGNYDLTVTPGTLTITKKAITVTVDDKTKVIGAVDPALTYKVTSGSLESGDSFSGALTRSAGEAVGTYGITQGTLTAGANYAITFEGSILKIVYGWDGFLQPINDTAHQTGVQQSKFKLGQTIPAKFLLKNAAGAVVRQATDPTFSRSGNLGACDATAASETTDVVTPDAGVTYGWDGSQYHYNWSTKGLTGGEYRIYANLADGTKQSVDICLAK